MESHHVGSLRVLLAQLHESNELLEDSNAASSSHGYLREVITFMASRALLLDGTSKVFRGTPLRRAFISADKGHRHKCHGRKRLSRVSVFWFSRQQSTQRQIRPLHRRHHGDDTATCNVAAIRRRFSGASSSPVISSHRSSVASNPLSPSLCRNLLRPF